MNEAAEAIRALATRAQTDLSMDYAWLDDVTTLDWAKFHELMDTWETFTHTATAIQNGTFVPPGIYEESEAQTPIPDPLIVALDNLQAEFNDITVGFGQAIKGTKIKADGVLSGRDAGEDGFFSVKHEKGERVDDMRQFIAQQDKDKAEGKPLSVGGGKEPVAVLPVNPKPTDAVADDFSRVLVGKDKVQVEEAVRGVGERNEL
ncbi:hypothetical protein FA15DRAFT_668796, partial [Coprinopsis marcescibilis]